MLVQPPHHGPVRTRCVHDGARHRSPSGTSRASCTASRPGWGYPLWGSTREEVVAELWAQLKDALNDSGKTALTDADRLGWFMDPAVTGLGGPDPQNREQLMIHPTGTFYNRPTARTRMPNFFLAGDYVRTDIDLASMEGANEAARAAVNALLEADNSDAERCAACTARPSWNP